MKKLYLLLLCSTMSYVISAQPILAFNQQTSITGITSLVDIVSAKDGTNRLFLVQQDGIIKIWNGTAVLATPFINISSVIVSGGEQGLLSLVFDPNYTTNGYFYVYYTNTAGSITVARYAVSANPNVATNAGTVLITIPHPTYTNHNGGKLNFGSDGYLYFGTGDGGSSNDPFQNSQNTNSLLGKMLRIDVSAFATAAPFYSIPPTNPFVTSGDGIADEVFALGLRNPFRWSFDRQTNDMWIADVGQNAWEEINYRPAGSTAGINYQWRCLEATHTNTTSGVQPCTQTAGISIGPVYEYFHNSAGGFSITGGYVYRGSEYAGMQGWYFSADYVRPNVFMVKPDGMGGYLSAIQNFGVPSNISTFGEDENGVLYAGTLGGAVYKVVQTGLLPIKLLSFTGNYISNTDLLQWSATTDPALLRFEIERSADGLRFEPIGTTPAQSGSNTPTYKFSSLVTGANTRYYRLRMVYNNGTSQYSSVILLNSRNVEKITALYGANGEIKINTPYALRRVTLLNNAGQKVNIFNGINMGSQVLATGVLPAGIYWVQCVGDKVENIKIAVL